MNRTLVIASTSLETVRAPIDDDTGANLSLLTVQMAFTAGEPTGPDWKSATWYTQTNPTRYLASCLVGPGGTVTLAEGTYYIWSKVTGSPDVPVKRHGVLVVT